MLLRTLCALLICAACAAESTNVNELLDQLLDVLRVEIVKDGKDQLAIDNIGYNFNYKVLFVTVYGGIDCSGGRARYLSTIKRTGEATGEMVDDGITVQASVGLETMQFLFDECHLSIKDLVTIGESLGGTVSNNSLTIRIYFTGNTARVDGLRVDDLSGIELTTGTNIIHRLENGIINGLVDRFHDLIIDSINGQLKQFEGKTYVIPNIVNSIKHKN